jgi:hypothetical protein
MARFLAPLQDLSVVVNRAGQVESPNGWPIAFFAILKPVGRDDHVHRGESRE